MKRISSKKELDDFRWRDRKGNFYHVGEMETRHVFYTWLMIWDHAAPKHLRFRNRKYIFTSFYTPDYMLKAFEAMYRELKQRNLTKYQKYVLHTIEDMYSPEKITAGKR